MDRPSQMLLWMMLSIVWPVFANVLVPSHRIVPSPPCPSPHGPGRVLCQLFVWLTTKHSASCVLRGSAWLGLAWLSCCYFNQQQCAGCRSMWSPSRSCPIIADPAAAYTKPQQQHSNNRHNNHNNKQKKKTKRKL